MAELRLETERLLVALPQPEDAALALPFSEFNRDHFAPWRPPEPEGMYTQAYWDAQIALMHARFESGAQIRLWIWAKNDSSKIIGTISFS